jgi:uncharacterized membrane protein
MMAVKQEAIQTKTAAKTTSVERHMANLIGRTLRIGVVTSAALIVLGLVLFFATDKGPQTVDEALGKTSEIVQIRPSTIIDGLRDTSPESYIQLGILVLILTPIIRVAMTAWLFARQRDWTFVALATIVLCILLLGLLGIGA